MPNPELLTFSNSSENTKNIWRHRFNSISEYFRVKSLEMVSGSKRLFSEALDRTKLFIEEGCSNALCGASTHYMASFL